MNTYHSMQVSFEREKNIKASAITMVVCLLLFLLFFFLQWTLPQIPAPSFGEGIEVNLGNSETGAGDVAPQVPGEPSATQDVNSAPPRTTQETSHQPNIVADENADADAPVVNKPLNKPATKPLVRPENTARRTTTTTSNAVPTPPKPKAVFKGGTSTTSSGNRADSYNGVRDQGIAGGKGDQGNPNGNPNSDSYTGNAASGHGGNGGSAGGVSIRSGLDGRRITRLPSFEDDFNENAKVAVDITVDRNGNVTQALVNVRGTTTTSQNIRNIALRKARLLKLNAGNTDEQTGTLVFSFKLKG